MHQAQSVIIKHTRVKILEHLYLNSQNNHENAPIYDNVYH